MGFNYINIYMYLSRESVSFCGNAAIGHPPDKREELPKTKWHGMAITKWTPE